MRISCVLFGHFQLLTKAKGKMFSFLPQQHVAWLQVVGKIIILSYSRVSSKLKDQGKICYPLAQRSFPKFYLASYCVGQLYKVAILKQFDAILKKARSSTVNTEFPLF